MYVIYWKIESNVIDLRVFKDNEKFANWIIQQVKLEPIAIVGIYDKNTKYGDVRKDYDKFVERFTK